MLRIDQFRTLPYGTTHETDLVPGLTSESAAIAEAAQRQRDALVRTGALAVSTFVYQWDGQRLQRLLHREDSDTSAAAMPTFHRWTYQAKPARPLVEVEDAPDFAATGTL